MSPSNSSNDTVLDKNQESHFKLLNNLDEGFELLELIFDKQGKVVDFVFLEVNPAYERQTGLKAADILGKRKKEVAPAADQDWYDFATRAVETNKTLTYQYYNPNVKRYFKKRFIPISKNQVAVLFKDITEQKQIKETLHKKQLELNTILDSAPTIIFYKDREGKFIQANNAFAKALNTSKKRLLGKAVFDLYSPEIAQSMRNDDLMVMESKRPKLGIVEPYESPAGLRWIKTDKIPTLDENGEVTGIIGFSEEITERKLAEEALRESEAKYRELVDKLPEMVFEVDTSGYVCFVNSSVAEFTGYSKEELENNFDANRLVAVDDTERSIEDMKIMLIDGKRQSNEYLFVKKNGDCFPVLLISAPIIKEDKIIGVRGIGIDLTERKHMEKRLKESERLAAIGTTAGMVGHDIRNPLQAIVGDVYLLKDFLTSTTERQTKNDAVECLESIEKNIGYINKIVADLQDYSRPLKVEDVDIHLYELVVGVFETIALPANIFCAIDIKSSFVFKSDPTLLKRILTNLIINSIQAMPNGGKLAVSSCPKKDKAVIIVKDTGVGIPEILKPELFKPMVTTKSKGQGLGLAVVKRLVESMHGTICFESQEGKGTKFIIELPIK